MPHPYPIIPEIVTCGKTLDADQTRYFFKRAFILRPKRPMMAMSLDLTTT